MDYFICNENTHHLHIMLKIDNVDTFSAWRFWNSFTVFNNCEIVTKSPIGYSWLLFFTYVNPSHTIVNINAFAYGSMIGWPAFALPQMMSSDAPVLASPLTEDEASWLASLMSLGALLTTPVYSALPSFMGRKMLGYLTALPLLISWIIIMFARYIEAYYVAKLLSGLMAAGTLVLPSMYVSEIVTDVIRGALGTLLAVMMNAGILFAYVVGSYVSFDATVWVNLSLPLVFVCCFFWLPETPFYLLSRGRREEALASLRWFRGDGDLQTELWQIQRLLDGKTGKQDGRSLSAILRTRGSFVGMAIVVTACANQMLCGTFPVLSYALTIFREAGTSLPPHVCTIIIGAMQVLGSMASTALVDRVGRKVLLVVSQVVLILSLAALGTYFYLKNHTFVSVEVVSWIPVTSLSLFLALLSAGTGPVTWVLISETVSPRVRGVATLLGFSVIWGLAFATVRGYSAVNAAVGLHGSYWIFSGFCVLGLVIILLLFPETKGRPLEEILKQLNGGKPLIPST